MLHDVRINGSIFFGLFILAFREKLGIADRCRNNEQQQSDNDVLHDAGRVNVFDVSALELSYRQT